mmetsp:Transcript_620/g.2284  ORF Transcript_620/g.2284 Transcript_620/m.2284 type:complete len:253 (+) Transcript_620:660-1418(+)
MAPPTPVDLSSSYDACLPPVLPCLPCLPSSRCSPAVSSSAKISSTNLAMDPLYAAHALTRHPTPTAAHMPNSTALPNLASTSVFSVHLYLTNKCFGHTVWLWNSSTSDRCVLRYLRPTATVSALTALISPRPCVISMSNMGTTPSSSSPRLLSLSNRDVRLPLPALATASSCASRMDLDMTRSHPVRCLSPSKDSEILYSSSSLHDVGLGMGTATAWSSPNFGQCRAVRSCQCVRCPWNCARLAVGTRSPWW